MNSLYEFMLMVSYFVLGLIVCKAWMKSKKTSVWNDIRSEVTEKVVLPKYHQLVNTLSTDGEVRQYCQYRHANFTEHDYFVDAKGQRIEHITHWKESC